MGDKSVQSTDYAKTTQESNLRGKVSNTQITTDLHIIVVNFAHFGSKSGHRR